LAGGETLGLLAANFVDGAMEVAFGGVDAALQAGERGGVVGESLAVGNVGRSDGGEAFALAFPDLGFGPAVAAE
jgi:hypothetical protein